MAPVRILIAVTLGLLAGTAWQLQQPVLGEAAVAWIALGAWLVCAGACWIWRTRWALAAGLVVCAALGATLGWELTRLRAAATLAEQLPAALEGVDLELVGVVRSLPTERRDGVRFLFEVEQARRDGQPLQVGADLPRHISLGWYASDRFEGDSAARPPHVQAGDRWRLAVRLRQPHGLMNPNGFDYEFWLFEQGVRATGSVRAAGASANSSAAMLLGDSGLHRIQRWRQALRSALQQRLGDTAATGVLAGLIVGDQAAIDRADWDTFRITGTAHLLAVSGLHIALLAWVAAAAVQALWRRSRRAMHWLPAQDAARWGGLLAAVAYALLAGWGVPAQRTVLMLAVLTALRAAGLRWPGPLILLCCAAVVALADPWALLQPGYWLSFVAVALLMVSEPVGAEPSQLDPATPRGRLTSAVQAMWRSQWVASVGLAPWTLIFFQQVSLIGLLANAVAIPALTLVITPLALLGVLLPPLWPLAAWLVEALMSVLGQLATVPLASWNAPAAPLWAQALAVAGALLFVLPTAWRLRLLGPLLMLPLIWPAVVRPGLAEFDLLAADIGQGNAVLVRTASRTLLYDTGPQYSRDSDAGERVLLPLLRAGGSAPLDLLVLSHRDSDHTGGAAAIVRSGGVVRVAGSLEDGHPWRALAPYQGCGDGLSWRWDGVDFEFLHPVPTELERRAPDLPKSNAVSCVLRVSNGRRTLLLTGDIERDQEHALVGRHGAHLAADVMLVPHHGSRTSSSSALLRAVQPRWGLVQSGYRNRYGHPAPDVVARLNLHDIGVVRTDLCGAWHWRSADASSWCVRDRQRRYWHRPPLTSGSGPEFAKASPFLDQAAP